MTVIEDFKSRTWNNRKTDCTNSTQSFLYNFVRVLYLTDTPDNCIFKQNFTKYYA